MRVLTIGSDRSLFIQGSPARLRIAGYADVLGELHIIVFALGSLGLSEVHDGALHLYPTNSRSKLRCVFDAIRMGKKIPADVVTTQDPFEAGWVGYRIAQKQRVPLQLQVHTDIFAPSFAAGVNRVRLMVARFLFGEASCVRTTSQSLKEKIEARYRLRGAVSVLPVFIDPQMLRVVAPVGLRQKYLQFDKIVVSASRLEPEKNVAATLRVFAKVLEKHPKVGLILLNTGGERGRLAALAVKLDIAHHVVFEGFSDVPVGYFKEADALIQTSNYEGYGMAVIEALAVGCPVVSTDVGIAREAGAHVWDTQGLAEILSDVLAKGERGSLTMPLLSKEQYLAEYKRLLETCGA
ncbi:MAG: glycosyltransferase [Patescibacteria group bacterium]